MTPLRPSRSRGPAPNRRDFFRAACAAGVLTVVSGGPAAPAPALPGRRFLCGNLPATSDPYYTGLPAPFQTVVPTRPRAIIDLKRLWKPGATISTYLVNGTAEPCLPIFYDRIVSGAAYWERYANVSFAFKLGPPPPSVPSDADVLTINCLPFTNAFTGGGLDTFNSSVGTDARLDRYLGPTMNLIFHPGVLSAFPDAGLTRYFDSAILHEFGHALGFGHEHQRRDRPFTWKKPAVYDFYRATNGWDQDMVDQQLDDFFDAGTMVTAFDPVSVMMYPIPEGIAEYQDAAGKTQPFQTSVNSRLSPLDKVAATWAYPPTGERFVPLSDPVLDGAHVAGRIGAGGEVAFCHFRAPETGPYGVELAGSMAGLVSVSQGFDPVASVPRNNERIHVAGERGRGDRPVVVPIRLLRNIQYRLEVRYERPREVPGYFFDYFTLAVRRG